MVHPLEVVGEEHGEEVGKLPAEELEGIQLGHFLRLHVGSELIESGLARGKKFLNLIQNPHESVEHHSLVMGEEPLVEVVIGEVEREKGHQTVQSAMHIVFFAQEENNGVAD